MQGEVGEWMAAWQMHRNGRQSASEAAFGIAEVRGRIPNKSTIERVVAEYSLVSLLYTVVYIVN